MNWEAIGAIAETLGAIGVIATLVYLALQIRQNTNALEQSQKADLAQAYQHRSESRRQMGIDQAESRYMAPISVKLSELGWPDNLDAIDSLDQEERFRFQHMMAASMTRLDNACYQHHQGLLDEQAWTLSKNRMRVIGPTWKKLGLLDSSTQRFIHEVELLIGETK